MYFVKDDVDNVLDRAFANHLDKIIITGTTLDDSRQLLEVSKKSGKIMFENFTIFHKNNLISLKEKLFITAGVHPTRSNEFVRNPDDYFASLLKLVQENSEKVVAIGECGLDYDRLHFCTADIQKKSESRKFHNYKI